MRILVVESNPSALYAGPGRENIDKAGEGYAAALRELSALVETDIVSPYDGDSVRELSGYSGIVFTGSGVEWNTDDARAEPLARVMRAGFAAGVPTLGSCNGMQLAASVLGGSSPVSYTHLTLPTTSRV